MTTKELQDQFPDAFKNIGGIFVNLNRIETQIIVVLTVFFSDWSNPNSEKSFILNDALFDEGIFPALENKRRLLIKVIKHLWRVAEEYKVPFDKDGFVKFCDSINGIQKIRNQLAHHSLGFTADGKAHYRVRKSNEERLNDQKTGTKTGTSKEIDIDLEKELAESQQLCDDAEKFVSDFFGQSHVVLLAQQKGQAARRNK